MTALTVVLSLAIFASVAEAEPFDWAPASTESVVEVLTSDTDGELRETPVWIVVIDDVAYVRTNASKWLANIRRGSAVRVRVRGLESGVLALEVADATLKARVEKAFKKKYGSMQRMMSAFRMSEPVVLRLAPKAE
jgi:hypothetical protein